ncbi:hypothetical protein RBH29_03860 [Herbivorax sp. ANBcel31]|uniref:hypothetical protein n=1 Tax=Herbivorax sp. ANBcel31 TaxID=3069754 RepID=UPI0027B85A7D|nr:hypothetical protein [Herbivorax sp. ANBcel31]MDQ2085568.1 hypothetical protein [Herbivorax sp. ANBcel31]
MPKNKWGKLFVLGLVGMVIILAIDSALIALGAIKFNFAGLNALGLPLPYWISYIPGGILFAHFYPTVWIQKFLYILFAAVSFVFVEFITIQIGLFQHLNWNIFNAIILNIGGFTIYSWFTEFYFERKRVQI